MESRAASTDQAAGSADAPSSPRSDFDVIAALRRALVAFVVLAGATLALGGLGTLLVFDSSLGELEADAVQWFADNRTGALDIVAKVGAVTDTWTAIGVMFGAMTILIAVRRERLAALIIVAMALELATFLTVGAIIDRPRPEVDSIGAVPSTPSFPSGHAAGTVALYGSLMFAARRKSEGDRVGRKFTLFVPVVLAIVIAVSRVYDGVHYPSDVVVGLLVGTGAFIGALYVTDLISELRAEVRSPQTTRPDSSPESTPDGA